MLLTLFFSLYLSLHSHAQSESPFDRKMQMRKWIMSHSLPTNNVAPAENDKAENLVDPYDINGQHKPFLSTLADLDLLRIGSVGMDAWSDSYWPTYEGGIAFRYADPNAGRDADWKINFDKFMQSTPEINFLSPSEKYEFLTGDTSKYITNLNWAKGKSIYDRFGKVADWIGICHGTAQASHRKKRPIKPVTLVLENGQSITFFPADIKALASSLWATLDYSYRFIGGRCEIQNPNRDANGRINEPEHPECNDSNPATLHLALLNQIGDRKKSLVMDSENTDEVWNYPIISYQYSYFNPKTKLPVATLAEAKALLSDFADPYKSYRDTQAMAVIGVQMHISYLAETNPTVATSDSRVNDNVKTADYNYDLELNANNQIIGGEWYSQQFPDFLWTPTHGAHPRSAGDSYAVETWNGVGSIPRGWKLGIQKARAQGRVLPKLVDLLIEKSAN